MDIYDILLYLIKGILITLSLILLYTLITRPKEILFGLLRYMKDGRIAATFIFAPIWFPALLLDKHFKLGIFEANSKETNDTIDNSDKNQNMTKRYPRTEKDFVFDSIPGLIENVEIHTRAGFPEVPKTVVYRRFNQLVNFLHLKELTTLNIIENIEQISNTTGIKNSDLNDKGFYFLQSCGDKWYSRLDKDRGEEKEWKYLEKWYASFKIKYEKDNPKKNNST